MKFLPAVLAASLLVMPACVSGQSAPATPTPVNDILYARRFTLQVPYKYTFSKEQPLVTAGTLVVLQVDPALVARTDQLQPVLYAGDVAVQRLNHGDQSGRVIGIVPGSVNLATAPIWFGPPQLPERVTAADARAERGRAEKAGVRPFGAQKIAAVERPAVAVADLGVLLRDVAAQLVEQFSPQEKELADAWRLPEATSRKRPY